MAPLSLSIYHRLGKPVRATTAIIDDHQFVSLWTATLGVVPSKAWDYKDPHHRHTSFSVTGVPKAIDWTAFPDWFDLSVHWRGYTPSEAVDHDWWQTLGEYVIPLGKEFRIIEKVVEWRLNRITHLRKYVETLIETLPIAAHHIPTPRMEDVSGLAAVHASEAGAYHALAKSRYHFADLAGFFCYAREVFTEYFDDGEIDMQYPPSLIWTPWTTQKKTGYLVEFPFFWKTHNIPMWLAHNIPIHYPWTASLSDIPRLSRLDPDVLQAHDEDVLGPLPAKPAASVYFKVQDEEEYDEWLQMAACTGYNTPHQVFSKEEMQSSIDFYFTDFEEWDSRTIENVREASFLSEIFFYKDRMERSTQKRHRRIYGYRPQKGETLEHIGILLPSSTLNFPFSHRELYKFVYATSVATATPTPTRTLLDRLSLNPPEDGEIVDDDNQGSVGSVSASSRSRSSRWRGDPFVRAGLPLSRERSASPARSGHSSSSRYSLGPSQRRRSIPRDVAPPPRSIASEVAMTSPTAVNALTAEGNACLTSILPSGTDHFPASLDTVGRWSAAFLREASFAFPDTRTEWRFLHPDWAATRLLNAALSFHMPLRLEFPASAIAHFARQKASYSATELASRPFYSAGSVDLAY
ncbi:hypothetical protein FIBSPDRAFT_955542 [Athelia psychrophila]|uniref:Uncharacterized protein n=1 Tax=Athelia psychrophila TaxID=1759441 RepID=A0A166HTR7_9AGAM|nr:hypothetical protein FIBSPDRAFT_892814 [Fibularhizoctonia sp. CBS 109695]KZP19224.1 hypothetical protein FIBSPDRAFT_955542 [Fibularhizoctonia sp. CBS 109695]